TITAEDNITQKIYIINHYIAKDTLSTNANINAIYIDGEELPNFHPDTLSYHYELPANYSGFPTINVDLQDDKASYTLIPPDALPGLVVIEVLAQDGETSLSYNIDFSIHVNITEIHSSDNITLYPNPSTGLVNISYDALQPNIDKVQVVDMYGKIIQTLNNTHVYIDLSDVAKGIYFVRFLSKQHIIKTHKIIKL
ncbi:MAG: T9SS type A sorting domain-containing protein, partial [Bacteroidales bacterium]|nr:T9SS type A sorting domain-containing protein [Bacteroidales bacterium]